MVEEDGIFSSAGSHSQVNTLIYSAALIQLRSVHAGCSIIRRLGLLQLNCPKCEAQAH